MTTATISILREDVSAGLDARVDRQAGVIRGVRVLGRISKNGREYTAEAVRNAVGLYEGRAVNLDHPDSANRDRSVSSRIGWLSGVKQSSDGGSFRLRRRGRTSREGPD